MQRVVRKVSILVVLLTVCSSLLAQLSDEQVIREAVLYNKQGMSQAQIFQELAKKGVTSEQFQRLQSKINYQQASSTIKSNYDPTEGFDRDDTGLLIVESKNSSTSGNQIYGQNFFSQENLSFAPNMNMPTPANYVLGSGDEIIIDVWGDSELNLRYVITPDGYINVPGIGRVQLNGMTVEQATSRIRNLFSTIYSDLDSVEPRTFLGISIGNTRTIKVNVMGEVSRPGTYALTSFASAFHALYAAGGTNSIGSLRNIRVFRSGKIAANIDLYEYLMKGNNMGDITLRDGDVVKVETFGIIVQIKGGVKRPMKYEMLPHETINDLIRFAGGFAGSAYRMNVLLDRKGTSRMESYTITDDNYSNFDLKDGDIITVGEILSKFSNAVRIDGAVNRPGKYAIGERVRTLSDLLNIAQGPTEDAFLERVLLYREKEDLTTIMESVNLSDLMNDRIPDIVLRRNDRLFVPSIIRLTDNLTVYVGGEVRNPGHYPYADNMSVEDIILRAGGLTEAASTAKIDLFRRIKNPKGTNQPNRTGEFFTFSIDEGLSIIGKSDFVLHPYDQVLVRKSPQYKVQRPVTVEGEVLFGGSYAKLYDDERLSSFIQRAGGFTKHAYVKGARLTRKLNEIEIRRAKDALKAKAQIQSDSVLIEGIDLSRQYVGIDLEKAMKKPGGEDDIILRAGDIITIPQYEGTVKITGGVLHPNTVTYHKRLSLQSYIRQAGGYSRLAMKTKPYVIYMNGKIATGRWAKIEPGCEIVVPEKPEREPISMQAWISASTSVATLAYIVLALLK